MSESPAPEPPLLHALSIEQIREIAFQSAGCAAGVFMRRHPDDIMPEKTISVGVEKIIAEALA